MDLSARIEAAVTAAVRLGQGGSEAPVRLAQALEYAVTPGGARIRPTLCLSVALACGDDRPALSDAAAASLELIHCGSLVHDDLPCFDDADIRRGKATLHRAYSEPLAVLAGDSLITLGFEVLARAAGDRPDRALRLVTELAQRTGMPGGICAGQGWESEPKVDLAAYHRAKTGALFIAATRMGAIASGQDPDAWEELGDRIGAAFQVADDLKDALDSPETIGKPAGQDVAHGRPNAVTEMGVPGAIVHLKDILAGAISSIPACPGEAMLARMVRAYAERMTPVHHATAAQ
ncbi:polyprenyl synthetase family protein [Rhodobacter sp. Har01]|uniref:polyprenyl synthetase family protein n=1 Tax=Rhodobacter sp. Har01 TaxID=2883999 RepID=UPI001D06D4C6|nr:polyprenyl synthetase family protein [Rhodobacter sp. Har01]MCB6176867.1 polyprenyl synthetase family protein [Rhodobacter sp. Har01]